MFEIKAQGSVSGRFYKVILIAESHFTFSLTKVLASKTHRVSKTNNVGRKIEGGKK